MTADGALAAAAWEALVDHMLATETALTPLAAGILAALALDLAADSRSFASRFGLAHALVLREAVELAEVGLITFGQRQGRSQRQAYHITPAGAALCTRAEERSR